MHVNAPTHRHTDAQTHRHTDTQTHRHTDTQTHRHTDTHTHTLEKRIAPVQDLSNIATTMPMLSLRVFAIIASVLWLLYYRILVRLYALCLCWNQAPHSSSQTNPVFLCISSGVSAAVSCTGASSRLLTCTVCRSGHEVLNLQGCWVACSTSSYLSSTCSTQSWPGP